jgi:hypothetical protein
MATNKEDFHVNFITVLELEDCGHSRIALQNRAKVLALEIPSSVFPIFHLSLRPVRHRAVM